MTPNEALLVLLEHREEFAGFVRRRVSLPDADDVLQQAFMTATLRVADVRREDALVAWFYQLLRSAVADHQRASARAARPVLAFEPDVALPPHEIGTCACSVALLSDLPASYAEILTQVDVHERPLEAVAAELGSTVNNATVRLHRARRALRDRLAACCGSRSSKECLSCGCV